MDALAEEHNLLVRVKSALERARADESARARSKGMRSLDVLTALRDEASTTAEDDLPTVLHEMSVRQRLLERSEEPLPDPNVPYIAHLRVREGDVVKDYLLGRATLVDPRANVRLVDWRSAPVSRVFYEHREGDDYELELPTRVAEGTVLARRIVVIERGELVSVIADSMCLERGTDGAFHSTDRGRLSLADGGAGAAARAGILGVGAGDIRARNADVTALLDADQFRAVCSPALEPLLVLGSAGSGKTTVALHRLARITAMEPERFPLEATKVVVPEEGLARLSRRLLEPLGASAAQVATLDEFALDLARHVFREPLPGLSPECPGLVVALKRHPALYGALESHFSKRRPKRTNVRFLWRRLADLFTDREFLRGVVQSAGGTLSLAAVEETVRHTMLALQDPVERELRSVVDRERRHAVDGRAVAYGTPDEYAGTIDVEDLPILLWLKISVEGIDVARVSHLVADEAEDFSLFELSVLKTMLGTEQTVTLAGDAAQQTNTSFAGFEPALEALGVTGATTIRLETSYRCPEPVVQVARAILGSLAPEGSGKAARSGAPVYRRSFSDDSQALLFAAGAAVDLVNREPFASVAVILSDEDAARHFHPLIAEHPACRLVTAGEFSFEPGIDVTHVDAVKGLEFDYVVVPDANAGAYPKTDEARRRLHVAVTRTAHQLWILSGPGPSPIGAISDGGEPP